MKGLCKMRWDRHLIVMMDHELCMACILFIGSLTIPVADRKVKITKYGDENNLVSSRDIHRLSS